MIRMAFSTNWLPFWLNSAGSRYSDLAREGCCPEISSSQTLRPVGPAWIGALPTALPEPATYYDRPDSKYPDRIRVSFADGRTFVYELRAEQPHPVIEENIKIIRKMKESYVNQPARRKKK